MKSEFLTREVTEEGETPFIEVTVRLSNGHFESKVMSSMGDPEGARAAIEAWVEAMDHVLTRFRDLRGERRVLDARKT